MCVFCIDNIFIYIYYIKYTVKSSSQKVSFTHMIFHRIEIILIHILVDVYIYTINRVELVFQSLRTLPKPILQGYIFICNTIYENRIKQRIEYKIPIAYSVTSKDSFAYGITKYKNYVFKFFKMSLLFKTSQFY